MKTHRRGLPARCVPVALVLGALALGAPSSAQESGAAAQSGAPPDAYLDAVARTMVERARIARTEAGRDILGYTAVVKQRTLGQIRMPLKDRTVYRYEAASLVRWRRDGDLEMIYLAGREQHPGGIDVPRVPYGLSEGGVFDPAGDRLYFGLADIDEDIWIHHPLAGGAEARYRYRTGDTLTIRLQDGRRIEAVSLEILPRQASPRLVSGALWIEPGSGQVVRAVYRLARAFDLERDYRMLDDDPDGADEPDDRRRRRERRAGRADRDAAGGAGDDPQEDEAAAGPPGGDPERRDDRDRDARYEDDEDELHLGAVPGLFKPITFTIDAVVIDYALWELEHWLPNTMRAEGEIRAGVFRAPGEHEVSYEIVDVITPESDGVAPLPTDVERLRIAQEASGGYRARERRSGDRDILVLVPKDETALLESLELPPPIWDESPEFLSDEVVDDFVGRIDDLPTPPLPGSYWRTRWGLGDYDLVRYNRVESLSLGARASAELSWATLSGTARFGLADREPNAAVAAERATPGRTLTLRGYHELKAVDEEASALGFGASLGAFFLGRDDGEYYRASGGSITLEPAPSERRWYRWRVYGERQRAVRRETDIAFPSVFGDHAFRPVIAADPAEQLGTELVLRSWSGTDPRGVQIGSELYLQAETGDYELLRARATVRGAFPLSTRIRSALELAGGTAVGDVPVQRLWYLGGAHNLRGYRGSSAAGADFVRARAELARTMSWGAVAAFSDAGWAGTFEGFELDDARVSVGLGLSVLDGLIRLDLARGLRGFGKDWRFSAHLDSIL